MQKIVITVINYSNEEEVLRYAQLLSEQSASDQICLVVIVNKRNHECRFDLENEMKKIALDIEVFDPKENLGYLNGCFYGYREHMKCHEEKADWLFISNSDIEIPDRSFIKKFLDNFYEKDIWCIAPSVYSPVNNSYDNPHYKNRCSLKKVNSVIWINERPVIALLYSKLAKMKASLKRHDKQESQFVYSVHGCFFALKGEFIEKIKNNNYKGFLFSEETYIAENILLNGKKCFYDSSLEVIHKENSVTGMLGMKRKAKYFADSMKYIRDEFYFK